MSRVRLAQLGGYFLTLRQAGHTDALMDAAAQTNAAIVVETLSQAKILQNKYKAKNKFFTLDELDNLYQLGLPTVVDNSVVIGLANDVELEFKKKDLEVDKALGTIQKLTGKVSDLQQDNHHWKLGHESMRLQCVELHEQLQDYKTTQKNNNILITISFILAIIVFFLMSVLCFVH